MEQAMIGNPATYMMGFNDIARHCNGPEDIPVTCNMCWVSARRQDWPQLLCRLKNQGITTVLVSPLLQVREMQLALVAGARGYCGEVLSQQQVSSILATVSQSGIWVPETILARVVGNLAQMAEFQRHSHEEYNLTAREKAVTNSILEGKSNAEIALQLAITERTVKQHMSAILRKFQVKDRVGLLLKLGHFEKLS